MAQNQTKPPIGRIPTVKAILEACPWNTRGNDDAKEAARRLATQLQAREYLLWLIEEHPPNLTVAHGVTELMWSRDGVILEEIICGHAKWHLVANSETANSYDRSLKLIRDDTYIKVDILRRLERARKGRNRATHPRNAPRVAADYRTLSTRGLHSKVDFHLPWDLMRALGTVDTV
jgi:hypothetical protein